jgi:hypothetical protein
MLSESRGGCCADGLANECYFPFAYKGWMNDNLPNFDYSVNIEHASRLSDRSIAKVFKFDKALCGNQAIPLQNLKWRCLRSTKKIGSLKRKGSVTDFRCQTELKGQFKLTSSSQL